VDIHQLQVERSTEGFAGQRPTFYRCATQPTITLTAIRLIVRDVSVYVAKHLNVSSSFLVRGLPQKTANRPLRGRPCSSERTENSNPTPVYVFLLREALWV